MTKSPVSDAARAHSLWETTTRKAIRVRPRGLSSPIVSVFPLGAHVDPDGVRFAVASASAEAVEVCLVDGPATAGES